MLIDRTDRSEWINRKANKIMFFFSLSRRGNYFALQFEKAVNWNQFKCTASFSLASSNINWCDKLSGIHPIHWPSLTHIVDCISLLSRTYIQNIIIEIIITTQLHSCKAAHVIHIKRKNKKKVSHCFVISFDWCQIETWNNHIGEWMGQSEMNSLDWLFDIRYLRC